jgi:hypothetical protein
MERLMAAFDIARSSIAPSVGMLLDVYGSGEVDVELGGGDDRHADDEDDHDVEPPPTHVVDGGDDRYVEGGHGRHVNGGEDNQDGAATTDTGTLRLARGWGTRLAVFVSYFSGSNIDLVEHHGARANCGGSS